MKPTPVACPCGWRGRRKPGDCDCYVEWAISCRCAWGSCPKCNGRVWTAETMKIMKRQERETRAWLKTEEGKACLAKMETTTR